MQYVDVRFSAQEELRTYHNEGAPVRVGQMVQVEPRSRVAGNEIGEVVEIVDKPDFETKSVIRALGKADMQLAGAEGHDGLLSVGNDGAIDADRYTRDGDTVLPPPSE